MTSNATRDQSKVPSGGQSSCYEDRDQLHCCMSLWVKAKVVNQISVYIFSCDDISSDARGAYSVSNRTKVINLACIYLAGDIISLGTTVVNQGCVRITVWNSLGHNTSRCVNSTSHRGSVARGAACISVAHSDKLSFCVYLNISNTGIFSNFVLTDGSICPCDISLSVFAALSLSINANLWRNGEKVSTSITLNYNNILINSAMFKGCWFLCPYYSHFVHIYPT